MVYAGLVLIYAILALTLGSAFPETISFFLGGLLTTGILMVYELSNRGMIEN